MRSANVPQEPGPVTKWASWVHTGVMYMHIIERKKSICSLPPPCEVGIVVPLASLRSEPSTLSLVTTSEPYEGRARPGLVTTGSCPPHHLAQSQGRSCNSVTVSPVSVCIILDGSLSCGGVSDWRLVPICLSVHPSPAHTQWMVKSRVISELQEACWDMVSAMAGDIILLLDSDNDGIRTHAIKFVEGLIVTLSPRMADSEVPRRQEHDISLDRIPRDHPYIQYSECPVSWCHWPATAPAPFSSSFPLSPFLCSFSFLESV